jgi:GNAT superfamily N-acetyltransferase
VTASLRVEPLSHRHDRAGFACGAVALDDYFRRRAGQDVRSRVASCYVLTETGTAVLGFYTLAATSLQLTDLPPGLARRLPHYPSIPATLMGRLAVDAGAKGKGLGEFLLLDAFRRTLNSGIASYAFVVDPKDDTAASFYARYGLKALPSMGRRMFIPMAVVAILLA